MMSTGGIRFEAEMKEKVWRPSAMWWCRFFILGIHLSLERACHFTVEGGGANNGSEAMTIIPIRPSDRRLGAILRLCNTY